MTANFHTAGIPCSRRHSNHRRVRLWGEPPDGRFTNVDGNVFEYAAGGLPQHSTCISVLLFTESVYLLRKINRGLFCIRVSRKIALHRDLGGELPPDCTQLRSCPLHPLFSSPQRKVELPTQLPQIEYADQLLQRVATWSQQHVRFCPKYDCEQQRTA